MNGLLVVSAAPGAHPPAEAAVRAAAGYLPGGEGRVTRCPDGWVAFAGPGPGDRCPDAAGGFTVSLTRSVRGRTGDVAAEELARRLGDGYAVDGRALTGWLPPFGAAHRSAAGAAVVLAGDWLGLRQLYWWAGDRVAAVSTSALALAALTGAEPDLPALGVQSLLGWQVGLDTVVTGVTKLAPGSVAVLRAGRVEIRRYAEPPPQEESGRPLPAVVDELAGILREVVDCYLADHPDTVLQLSGGQDSRMLLCAVPAGRRPGLSAFTLDVHGGAESRVATALSRQCGLAHQVHWLEDRPPVDPDAAYRAARDAATALDAMASPLALGALDLIERELPQGRRLSGIGGETARGFYYPGQPSGRRTSPDLVERLARWRLFANEAVAADALDRDFAAAARHAAMSAVTSCFEQLSSDWLRATDEFYLWQRTQRWAGAHGTAASAVRHLVNPLLDRRFCQLVLALPPEHKRRSRTTGLLIHRLDPRLAEIPLDSGLVPAHLARPGLRSRAAYARLSGRKTASKVWQRVRGHRRPQLGAADLAARVLAHWRAAPDLVAPVRQTGIVRERWLDQLLDGQVAAPPATVSFLLNLLVVTEAVRVREDAVEAGPARRNATG